MSITVTDLRKNIYTLLDDVLRTGYVILLTVSSLLGLEQITRLC